jgi:hypothetical protein
MDILKPKNSKILWVGVLGIIFLTLVVGCSGTYGSYRRDAGVQQSFESNQVPTDFKYFYYGLGSETIAIFGIEKQHEMNSYMWKVVSANSSEFRDLVTWVWEDYGYDKFGAEILNPEGIKVGILYTAVRETAVKFGANNQITVMPSTPFLWGPVADSGGGVRSP